MWLCIAGALLYAGVVMWITQENGSEKKGAEKSASFRDFQKKYIGVYLIAMF